MYRDVKVLGIESIVRYFLVIVGILRIVIFSSRRNTLILQSCTLFLE